MHSLPKWTTSFLCKSTIAWRVERRILRRACMETSFRGRSRKVSERYLYTRTRWSGIVSSGTRSNVLLGSLINCGKIRSLKLLKILIGIAFNTKISCPDLAKSQLTDSNRGKREVGCIRCCPNSTDMCSLLEKISEAVATSGCSDELAW